MSPTIIRHRKIKDGYIVVISVSHSCGFDVWFQRYEIVGNNGYNSLEESISFSLESKAIEFFNRY